MAFSHNSLTTNGLSAGSLDLPYGVAVDDQRNEYVADTGSKRMLACQYYAFGVHLPLPRRKGETPCALDCVLSL